MASFRHPSELNLLQRYLQARKVLRTTSRATNSAWFESAVSLPLQLHVRNDGIRIDAWIYEPAEQRWSPAPPITDEILSDPDHAAAYALSFLNSQVNPKCKALGVVLHVADEFATAALDPDHDTPAALGELRTLIATDPDRILDDSSLSPETHSWRIFPYHGTGAPQFATAISIARRCEPFVSRFRELGEQRNFPVRTCTLSAPLVTLQTIPFLSGNQLGQPLIAALHYPHLTVLAFFNGHGNLLLLRTLQHRGHGRPIGLRHAATTTAAALEIGEPSVMVLPLADGATDQVADDLRLAFPNSQVTLVDWAQSPFSALPKPEPIACHAKLAECTAPLAGSVTFSSLRDEAWNLQDFLPPARELEERYPTRSEIKLLRAAGLAHLGIAAVALVGSALFTLKIFGIMRQPEWAFNATEAAATKQRFTGLGMERLRMEQWDNLLSDRSKAWPTMELLCRLFPERSGILLRSLAHTVRPDTTPGQARVGFVKEWRISGFAREESQDHLNRINSKEGINEIFSEVAHLTGNSAFKPDLQSRTIVVNLRTNENASFKPKPVEEIVDGDDTTYPFTFDLLISQRFESSDPMALSVIKAPPL